MSSVKEIRSVRNACALVEALARRHPLGVSELARITGIDKSAAHRLAVTLHRAGWIDKTSDGRWQISAMLGRFARRAAVVAFTAAMRPRMEALRDRTGETVMLVALDHARLSVQEVVESRHALRIGAPVGSDVPLARGPALRAIAAHLPPEELAALRHAHPDLDAEPNLAAVRRRGWTSNDGETIDGARVVGAPILAIDGYPLAALLLCGPNSRITATRTKEYGELVATAARASAAAS
jgi:DNA-binding IclR family transcriptional regulator